MAQVELTNKPKLDVILFVTPTGMEFATEVPAEAPVQSYKVTDIVAVKSYVTKQPIDIVIQNIVLIERKSEDAYLLDVERAKERAIQQRLDAAGSGITLPLGRIPGGGRGH